MRVTVAKEQADQLRWVMQRLFRQFGALAVDMTPCGKPLSMVHAHAVMVLLAKTELQQQELAAELCIDKSNVARLCAKMVEVGHAVQRQGRDDGRTRLISLTAEGKRLARDVDAASRARFAAWLSAVPSARRDQLIDSLEQLLAAMDVLRNHPLDEKAAQ
jgi:DNA-binding MarR family transcriptional regulator